jgi:MFS family permease
MTATSSSTTAKGGGAALAVLLAGTFMASLDTAIVNVAGPAIQSDVGVSGAALQLVISGYALAYAALLITGARLGDDHGHRRLFLLGLAGFTLTSLLGGLAWSTDVLIAARIGQGVAAAAMGPQVMTVIQLQYDGPARMRAMALLATVVASGVVIGQVLGGLLVDLDLLGASWRPVFLINVPVGVALLAVGPRLLPQTRAPRGRGLDLVGVLLLADLITLVMVPLTFGHQVDWAWWTWACLAAAVPTAGLLIVHLRRSAAPLVDLAILRGGPFPVGLLAIIAMMVAYGGFLLTFTLHLQQGLGDSPLRAGLTFAPYALGFGVLSLVVPTLPAATARRMAPLGMLVAAGAYAGLGLATRGGSWSDAETLPLLALAGAGFGAGYSQVTTRAIAQVPAAHAHEASGVFNTINMLGFAFGIATLGSAFLSAVHAPTPQATGAAFGDVALGCAALLVAAIGVVTWLARVEAGQARAHTAPDAARHAMAAAAS